MRLTNLMKDKIIKEIVNAKFTDEKRELLEKKCEECYNDLVKKHIPNGWDKYREFIRTCSTIHVLNNRISVEQYPMFGGSSYICFTESTGKESYNMKYITVSKTDLKPVKKLNEFKEDKSEFRQKTHAIIYAYTTDKKLIADIPECKKYLPNEKTNCMGLVPISDLKEFRRLLK